LAELGQQDVLGAGSLIGTVRTQDTPGVRNEQGQKSGKFDHSQDISKDLAGATTDLPSNLGGISKFEDSRILQAERSILITDGDDSILPNYAALRPAAANTTTGSPQQKPRKKSPASEHTEYMRDLDALHMYDSLLLSKNIEKFKKPSGRTQSINLGKFKTNQMATSGSGRGFNVKPPGRDYASSFSVHATLPPGGHVSPKVR
jgi:hypothetical protein